MFVQDIPRVLFDEFKDSDELLGVKDDRMGNTEELHIARLKCDGAGVICWSRPARSGKPIPVTFLTVLLLPFTGDVVKHVTTYESCLMLEVLRIRCGPHADIYSMPAEDPRDMVSVSVKDRLPMDYLLSHPVLKMALRASELWNSPELEKRKYPDLKNIF